MTGFGRDILKASISAVLTAILLGGAIYMFTLQIEAPAPTTAGILEAYTLRGGLGPNTASNFYFYNENISIFAHVKDKTNNPIADAAVTFKIHGPPNSNITLVQTTKTNSSGVAIANLTSPYTVASPETVLGIWSVQATSEVAGTQIIDSLAFQVESPPNPFVDVYTDRGGNGPKTSSQAYSPGESAQLYAKVNNGTGPVDHARVTFTAYGPANEPLLLTSRDSNASGMATETFRIPPVAESIGPWRIIVTVKINAQVFIDELTFQCTSPT